MYLCNTRKAGTNLMTVTTRPRELSVTVQSTIHDLTAKHASRTEERRASYTNAFDIRPRLLARLCVGYQRGARKVLREC